MITRMIMAIITATAMLEYDFMRNAFAAAGVAAVVSGVVGYFLVLRGQTFAGHALGHIGFAGATGAVLIGLAPLWGLLGFTIAAGIGMGLMGERLSGRDVAIGVVLALALGFGLLFLHYYTAFAAQATALLFGDVLAVDRRMIATLAALGVVTLIALAAIMRPLIFSSLQPELAEAKGVPVRFLSVAFLAIVALAVSESAQIVGVLLVFALMVGPPATAQRLASGLWSGIALSAAIALAEAWLGVTVAYYTDWPVSFCISLLSALGYFLARLPRLGAPGHGRALTGNQMTEQPAEKPRAICVGEALIELKRGADGRFALSCGGDAFNTAIYLARAGIGVGFATALGDDPYSESMMALAAAEGISSNLMFRVPNALPALCLVENGPAGERRARYWREGAPVRQLFELPDWMRLAEALTIGKARLFFRHHAVAVFQHRSWPLSRRARGGAPAGRQGGVRRQFPAARLERRPAAHAHGVHRNAQARRHCAADIR